MMHASTTHDIALQLNNTAVLLLKKDTKLAAEIFKACLELIRSEFHSSQFQVESLLLRLSSKGVELDLSSYEDSSFLIDQVNKVSVILLNPNIHRDIGVDVASILHNFSVATFLVCQQNGMAPTHALRLSKSAEMVLMSLLADKEGSPDESDPLELAQVVLGHQQTLLASLGMTDESLLSNLKSLEWIRFCYINFHISAAAAA